MASVLKSAGEFRRRVVVKSPMRRRFKIRQEIGANNCLNEVVFFAPFRGVDAGQPPQDIRDSSRSRPFALTPRITEKRTRQATSLTTSCFVHSDRSTTSSSMRSRRLNAGSLVRPTVHRRIASRNWAPQVVVARHVRIADRPPTMSLIAGVPDSIDPFNLLTPAVAGFSLISRCTRRPATNWPDLRGPKLDQYTALRISFFSLSVDAPS
jgi:hypothetical protein